MRFFLICVLVFGWALVVGAVAGMILASVA